MRTHSLRGGRRLFQLEFRFCFYLFPPLVECSLDFDVPSELEKPLLNNERILRVLGLEIYEKTKRTTITLLLQAVSYCETRLF